MKVTSKEFCKSLRDQAAKIASGEEVILRSIDLERYLTEEDLKKINASYIRMTLNRTPEIKAVGVVSVARTDAALEGDGFRITINRDAKRKVVTSEDVPAIERKAANRVRKKLLEAMPNIADLKGDELQGAATMAERYQAMIRKMITEEE